MPVTNYYTVNSEIIGEKTTGGSRLDYLTDALGSVTATMDQSANLVNTYRYKPYGAQLSKTGVGTDPAFQFVGSRGYKQTGKKYSDIYVRKRHYSSDIGAWTSRVDLAAVLAGEPYYGYGSANPITYLDFDGNQPTKPPIDRHWPGRFPRGGPPIGGRPVFPNDPRWPKPPDYVLPPGTSTDCMVLYPPGPLSVGEIWCIGQAYDGAVDAQRRLDPRRYPPGNGGPRDALRHCVGACLARRMCGENAYQHGIIGHERTGAFWARGSWDAVFSPMDLANDAEGRDCYEKAKGSTNTCESCCLAKLESGQLYILPWEYRNRN